MELGTVARVTRRPARPEWAAPGEEPGSGHGGGVGDRRGRRALGGQLAGQKGAEVPRRSAGRGEAS